VHESACTQGVGQAVVDPGTNEAVAPKDVRDAYQNAGGLASCDNNPDRPAADKAGCGAYYANYFRPFFDGTAVAMTSSSTGVGGGGVVRFVVKAGSSIQFRPVDRIRYSDRNVQCGNFNTARWAYGELFLNGQSTGRFAWYPQKLVDARNPDDGN
jgi:hypothetical protein